MSSIPFFVGSYTNHQDHVLQAQGEGISSCHLDLQTGNIIRSHIYAPVINPTYLVKNGHFLYATKEVDGISNSVYSFRIQPDQQLILLSELPTHGGATCHVHVHNQKLFSASYTNGNMDIYSISNGYLAHSELVTYTGSGLNQARQEGAHAHQVLTSPDGKWLYVCDLGSDKIWCHSHEKGSHQITGSTSTPSGSGPRHAVFHPTLPYLYVAAELNAHLLVYTYKATDGTLELAEDIYTLPPDYTGLPSSAAIRMHPSGNAVYISNRQHNSVAIYAIDDRRPLSLIKSVPSGGREPRDMNIDPTGNFLLIANQDDDNITVYQLNPENGHPLSSSPIHTFICKTPACIEF